MEQCLPLYWCAEAWEEDEVGRGVVGVDRGEQEVRIGLVIFQGSEGAAPSRASSISSCLLVHLSAFDMLDRHDMLVTTPDLSQRECLF